MNTIKIDRDSMLDYLGSPSVITDVVASHGRWHVGHKLTFRHTDGKVYITSYRRGATESQDEGPWENQQEVECREAHEVPRTGTEWVEIP